MKESRYDIFKCFKTIKSYNNFRIVDIVEDKYTPQAFILKEAINKDNEIVYLGDVEPYEDTYYSSPAADKQISKMLGYKGVTRRYKACMESLINSGLIYRMKPKNKKFITIYYFNPLYSSYDTKINPKLFIMFYDSFVFMSKINKTFKRKFDNAFKNTLIWLEKQGVKSPEQYMKDLEKMNHEKFKSKKI